jgi:hypothetical protein
MSLEQSPEFLVNPAEPIEYWLQALSSLKPTWPSKDQFAQSLGYSPSSPLLTNQWYVDCWWGFYANKILFQYLSGNREDQIVNLLETPDTKAIHHCLGMSKGLLLAGSHLAPELTVLPWLKTIGVSFLAITSNKNRTGDNLIFVGDNSREQKLSLAKSLLQLRKNGIVKIVPDGRHGAQSNGLMLEMNGRRTLLSRGPAELAYLSGAPTLWTEVSWTDSNRLEMRFFSIAPSGDGSNREEWIRLWYRQYLNFVWQNIQRSPRDIGFRRGGLFWDNSRWTPKP